MEAVGEVEESRRDDNKLSREMRDEREQMQRRAQMRGRAETWDLGSRISQKMWIERTIGLDLTIHVNQSHVTCKLDSNK